MSASKRSSPRTPERARAAIPASRSAPASRPKPATASREPAPNDGGRWAYFDDTVRALRAILALDGPADAVLSRFFREHRVLGMSARAYIAEAVFGVLREYRLLAALCADQATPRRLLLAWLARQGYNLREFAPIVSRDDERELIASAKGFDRQALPPAAQAELPDWAYAALVEAGWNAANIQTLGASLARPAPLDLRVNTLKISREAAQAALRAAGLPVETTPFSPHGLRLGEKFALQHYPLFQSGALEVQDEGSQILALLLSPRRGEMVADFCAGAGGKTLCLGMAMASSGRLYAFDISQKRLDRLRPRLARSGLSNVHPVLISHENDARLKRLAGKLDRVLVDAPCSGFGTLRRNPDLKLRRKASDLDELVSKQRAILSAAARLLKPGACLVYATCSILPMENRVIVDDFLSTHPGFTRVPVMEVLAAQRIVLTPAMPGDDLELWPHQHGCDAFYAAVLRREG